MLIRQQLGDPRVVLLAFFLLQRFVLLRIRRSQPILPEAQAILGFNEKISKIMTGELGPAFDCRQVGSGQPENSKADPLDF